eukprot:1253297-Prymnesium_polylepis.2
MRHRFDGRCARRGRGNAVLRSPHRRRVARGRTRFTVRKLRSGRYHGMAYGLYDAPGGGVGRYARPA